MMNKQFYEAPEAEMLEVRFEKGLLTDSEPRTISPNGSEQGNYRDGGNEGYMFG